MNAVYYLSLCPHCMLCNLYFFPSMPRILVYKDSGDEFKSAYPMISHLLSPSGSQLGVIFFPSSGDIEQCLETFWVIAIRVKEFWCYWYLGVRDAAKHPQCTGLALTTKTYLIQSVNSAKIQKPYYPHIIYTYNILRMVILMLLASITITKVN